MIISLPYPPTGNHAVKHASGRHYLTAEARTYVNQVRSIAICSAADNFLDADLMVTVEVFPPDHRRRDLDNVWKLLSDALTKANVWKDDYQVVDLRLVRGEVRPGGMVVVSIEEVRA